MNTENSPKRSYKTPLKRLLTCREANRKYYEKNRERNSKKVLARYHLRKEFLRLSGMCV